MKLTKKLVATGVCAGVSLALLTGCSSTNKKLDPNTTVAKMGDTELSLGVANLMFRFSQVQTGGYIRMLLGDDGSNIWEQDLIGNGTAYGETLRDSALEEYKRMVLLEQHMGEYNVEITEEEQSKITAAATQFLADNDPKVLEEMTATQETVERLLTLYTIEDKMQIAIEASADVEVTDEEAAQKTIRYAYFSIPAPEVTEEETEAASEEATEAVTEAASEEATEAVTEAASEEATEAETEEGFEETPERAATRAEVQALIDEIKAGTSFDDAVKAYDEEKNIIENHYGNDHQSLSEVLINAAEALSDGEIVSAPVEVENGFYIVEMVDTFDEEATAEEKEELLAERQNAYYNEVLAGWEPDDFAVDQKVWAALRYYDDFRAPVEEIEEETEAASEETSEAVTEAASEETSEAVTEAATEGTSEAASETAAETESES